MLIVKKKCVHMESEKNQNLIAISLNILDTILYIIVIIIN